MLGVGATAVAGELERQDEYLGLITEMPSPYRLAVFNALDERLGGRLVVYFMSERAGRAWPVYHEEMRFRRRMLPGRPLQPRGPGTAVYYLNGLGPLACHRDHVGPLVVGGYNHFEYAAGRLYTRARRRPLLLWTEAAESSSGGLLNRLKQRLVGAADAAIVPGTRSERLVQEMASALPVFRAPNCVDTEFWGAGAEARPEAALSRILFVGALIERKDLPTLVRALAARQLRGVVLDVVGEGPERTRAQELARTLGVDARFHGHLDREPLRELYRAAQVFVLPTRADEWGLVINEAMAAGCVPIVTHAAGAADDLVLPERTGAVFAPGDVEGLRAELNALATRPDLLAALSAGALALGSTFTPERCADGFVQALEATMGHGRRSGADGAA